MLTALALGIRENGAECGQVGMHISEYGYLHAQVSRKLEGQKLNYLVYSTA